MRIVFFGTSRFAIPGLIKIYHSKHKIGTVVTQPDRRSGRGLKVRYNPVKEEAHRLGLKIEQPEDILGESSTEGQAKLSDKRAFALLRSIEADLFVVISYGKILSRDVLAIPKLYSINLHGSLLPKYRGAAPINWAIINGEDKTGVTVIKMIEKVDAGDILSSREVDIGINDTAGNLEDVLSNAGAELLLDTINLIERGEAASTPQNEPESSYAPKLKKSDGLINWNMSAYNIHNRVRGMAPRPGAFTYIEEDGIKRLLKVWQTSVIMNDEDTPGFETGVITKVSKDGITVQTGDGKLLLKELQLEGGRKVPACQFVIGHKINTGTILWKE